MGCSEHFQDNEVYDVVDSINQHVFWDPDHILLISQLRHLYSIMH